MPPSRISPRNSTSPKPLLGLFSFATPTAEAGFFLSPFVASLLQAAESAIQSVLACNRSPRLDAYIFPSHTHSLQIFGSLGFCTGHHPGRMVLGKSSPVGCSPQTLSAAGFELG
jgi:hypothetical protein